MTEMTTEIHMEIMALFMYMGHVQKYWGQIRTCTQLVLFSVTLVNRGEGFNLIELVLAFKIHRWDRLLYS